MGSTRSATSIRGRVLFSARSWIRQERSGLARWRLRNSPRGHVFRVALDGRSQRECIVVDAVDSRRVDDIVLGFSDPVSSKAMASRFRASSLTNRPRTSIPFRAASDVLIATTSGIASSSACGQAMTSTVTTRSIPVALNGSAIHSFQTVESRHAISSSSQAIKRRRRKRGVADQSTTATRWWT